MSIRVMAKVWKLELPCSQKIVLLALADHANHNGKSIYPSVDLLTRKTGLTRRGVQKSLRQLETLGYIARVEGLPPKISAGRAPRMYSIGANLETLRGARGANLETLRGEPGDLEGRTQFAQTIIEPSGNHHIPGDGVPGAVGTPPDGGPGGGKVLGIETPIPDEVYPSLAMPRKKKQPDPEAKPKPVKQPDTRVAPAIDTFCALFQKYEGTPYPGGPFARDGKVISELSKGITIELIRATMEEFFREKGFLYQRRGATISVWREELPRLLRRVSQRQPQAAGRVVSQNSPMNLSPEELARRYNTGPVLH